MNDAAIMRRDQALDDLLRVVEGQTNRQGSLRQPFAQGLALQQFTNDVGRSVDEAHVVNGDNIGMIQCRRGTGFQFEPAEMIGIIAGSRPDHLQSYVAPQPFIARAENLAHGSSANFLEDPVVTYDLASHCA